jgi:hypothetical protein
MSLQNGSYIIQSVTGPFYFRFTQKQEQVEVGTEPILPRQDDQGRDVYDKNFVFHIAEGTDGNFTLTCEENGTYMGEYNAGTQEEKIIIGHDVEGPAQPEWTLTNVGTDDDPQYNIQSTYNHTPNWYVTLKESDAEITIEVEESDSGDEPKQKWVFTEVEPTEQELWVRASPPVA